ncbi:hypothetical protein SDC9_42529 [bioreactor metagenome]|uniref:Uncharacterized protein n=1 Tax=bioreactor metagenome TaxID=1076179 RepID=A0A644VY57_9ZZZZ
MDIDFDQDGIQSLFQTGEVHIHDARRVLACRGHLVHIPGPHRQQHIVQNSKGRGIVPGLWLCSLYKESSYEPVQVSPAAWENTRQLLFNAPVLKAVEQIEGHWIKLYSFQHAKISVPYMGRLMVSEALGQCQQFRLTIHGQGGQVNNLTVGAGLLSANKHLHAVAVAKDRRHHGQAVENVFCTNHGTPQ